jgi:cytochrome c biogenesis protein ResB
LAKAQAARSWAQTARELDPLRAVWRLFTSVRWALILLAFLALAGLLGVLLPQIPSTVRGDGAAVADWLDTQRGKFGVFTDPFYRLGFFDVFHARWFAAGLSLLVVSVTVCTANRFFPIWRTIRRPQRRVPETYFQRAHHRAEFSTPAEPLALEGVLRRHRYRVERFQEGEATYLFADRHSWAQLGTFVSHLALILFIAGALVSKFTGFSQDLFVGEGTTAPVFAVSNPNQMQVRLVDTVARFDPQGQPLDYRSELAIYQGGNEVKHCTATVNGPCVYNGYRFHQAAYFGFGAELQVSDLRTGNVIYKEVLALADSVPAPHVIVRDGDGQTLMDATLVLTDFVETAYGTTVTVPGTDRTMWIGVRPDESNGRLDLLAFEPGEQPDAVRLLLPEGERAKASGLDFEFVSLQRLPASFEPGFPLPPGAAEDRPQGQVLLEMSNVVYGVEETSSGEAVAVPSPNGPPTLSVVGISPIVVNLEPGQAATVGDYEYTFVGQREFAGINVKRDRSDNLIWLATGLLLVGLGITFYVPRRRLWAKITPERTYLAGVAGRLANLRREMGKLGAEAGSPDATQEEEKNGSP